MACTMLVLKITRYILVLAMTTGFLFIVAQSLSKFSEKTIGETLSAKKAAKMNFPSIYICPVFKQNYYKSHNSKSKNLTEYYESVPNIRDIILSIKQSYETKNG